jgi:hypothetical protein
MEKRTRKDLGVDMGQRASGKYDLIAKTQIEISRLQQRRSP